MSSRGKGSEDSEILFQTVRKRIDNESFIEVKSKISGVTTGFLAPLFFASIGFHLELSALVEVPMFVALLTFAAVIGKVVGAGILAYRHGLSKRDALAVGFGMSARGAVELIIADIAFRAGLFLQPSPPPAIIQNLFSAIVIVTLVTTLLTPIVLKFLLGKADCAECK